MLEHYYRDVAVAAVTATTFFAVIGSALSSSALRGVPVVSRFLLAPLIGFGVWTGLTVFLFHFVPFTTGYIVVLAGFSLTVALALSRRSAPEKAPWRVLAPIAAVSAVAAALPLLTIVPVVREGALFFSMPIFDHMKVAIVDSIHRSGLPPASPYYTASGEAVPLNYYYGWYSVAAMLRALPHLSGLAADAALTFTTAWISLLALGGLGVFLSGRAYAAYVAVFAALPLGLEEPLRAILRGSYDDVIAPGHGLEDWLVHAAWVPQHLMSGSLVVLSLFLVTEVVHAEEQWLAAGLLGLVAAAAADCSVYAGGFGLSGAAVVSLPLVVARKRTRNRLRRALPVVAALGVTGFFVLPYIRTLLRLRPQVDTPVLESFLWPTFSTLPRADVSSKAIHIIFYWGMYLVIQFGMVYVVGLCGLWSRKDEGDDRVHFFRVLSTGALLGDFTLAESYRSVIAANDFGWRVVLPAVLLLVVWSTDLLTRWLYTLSARGLPSRAASRGAMFGLMAAVALGSVGLVSSAGFVLDVFTNRARDVGALQLRRDFRAMEDGWAAVRSVTAETDVVACNPVAFQTVTPWPANAPASLFSDRTQFVSDADWPWLYSHQIDRGVFARDLSLAQRIFNGHPSADEFRQLATSRKVRALLVSPRDALWEAPPDPVWYRLVRASAGYRVYLHGPPSLHP